MKGNKQKDEWQDDSLEINEHEMNEPIQINE